MDIRNTQAPLVLSERTFQNKMCLCYLGISWTSGPYAILAATALFPDGKTPSPFPVAKHT